MGEENWLDRDGDGGERWSINLMGVMYKKNHFEKLYRIFRDDWGWMVAGCSRVGWTGGVAVVKLPVIGVRQLRSAVPI